MFHCRHRISQVLSHVCFPHHSKWWFLVSPGWRVLQVVFGKLQAALVSFKLPFRNDGSYFGVLDINVCSLDLSRVCVPFLWPNHGMSFAMVSVVSCGALYRQRSVFANHIKLTDFPYVKFDPVDQVRDDQWKVRSVLTITECHVNLIIIIKKWICLKSSYLFHDLKLLTHTKKFMRKHTVPYLDTYLNAN